MGLKKAYYFTLDAIIGLSIVLGAVLILNSFYTAEKETAHLGYVSEDMINVLSNIKISEINNSYATYLINSGYVTNPDSSVLEVISRLWVEGFTDYSRNLTKNVTEQVVPSNIDFSLVIEGTTIYTRNNTGSKYVLLSTKQLITGMELGREVEGTASRLYLSGIKQKRTSSYAYFGGFAGQGNLTVFINDIPSDANITDMIMELDAGDSFNLSINGDNCGSFTPSGTYNADRWNITSCNSSIVPGNGTKNNFTILFTGGINTSFIGGGFIKVSYITDQMFDNIGTGMETQHLPDITGIVNLFDSFTVPGNLNEMEVQLHYYVNRSVNQSLPFYLLIGNQEVYSEDNGSNEYNITLTNAQLDALLNYVSMSRKSVPFRLGFENVSFLSEWIGNADVSLITDVSGSMNWRMDQNNVNGVLRECDDSSFEDSDTRRISVAKCLDKQFAEDILNTTGNQVGLVSFQSSTSSTLNPTNNETTLNNTVGTSVPLTGYSAGGGTCICCGINSARDMLITGANSTTLIANNSEWLYHIGTPSKDSNGSLWYEEQFNDTSWSSDDAILGATNTYVYTPTVDTELGSNLSLLATYGDLWENNGDTAGPPNDFSSGTLNSTGNTYGISGADDGWDWDVEDNSGPFGYDDNIDYNNIVSGMLELDNNRGTNACTSRDCSGAYGILINVTQEMYNKASTGAAIISFDYEWDGNDNPFESADQVWVKAVWTSPTSGSNYLGNDLDSWHYNGDNDLDVATTDNPDSEFSGTFSQDISNWIEGPGMYYLEIGGKLRASASNEWGTWKFDNIQLQTTNTTDLYYFRKHFNIASLSNARKAVLKLLSDDKATIYLNGQEIVTETANHEASYWNTIVNIPGNLLQTGDNVIAVELSNDILAAKFDLSLEGYNTERDWAMMVMTDGAATYQCAEQGTGNAAQDAIQAACDARDYGITVYAVGFSDAADETTLEGIVDCGDGIYTKSDNTTSLQEFYSQVAENIIVASRQAQVISVEGGMPESKLYGDSYIKINYTPVFNPLSYGEISVVIQTPQFSNCSDNATISDKIRVVDSRVTSYSAEHWTDLVESNSNVAYNLTDYGYDFTALGDPFLVYIPSTMLTAGVNNITITSADEIANETFCSVNNSMIYKAMLKSSVPYSAVKEQAIGCSWTVEFFDGSNSTIKMPGNYTGSNTCSYTNTSISYDSDDSYDVAMYALLNNLDINDDGRVYINFDTSSINISVIALEDIPYMWGPSLVEVRTWQ